MRRKDREVTDIEEIKGILNTCKTICVGMTDKDTSYVVPLSYGYDLNNNGLTFYFHSAKEGRKIDILKQNNRVCFTVFIEGEPVHAETPCDSGYYYSSIMGNGVVEFITEPDEKKYALKRMFAHQAGREVDFTDEQANRVCVYKILSTDYTGKRKPKDKPKGGKSTVLLG